MNKLKFLLSAMLVFAMGIGFSVTDAEASGRKEKENPVLEQIPEQNLPSWLNEVPPEDVVWGIGFANLQNRSLAMRTAQSRAQRDVAAQISVFVQELFTDYAQESGLAGDPRSIISIENIGRDLINMTLSGAVRDKMDQMPDGTWWVRVSLKKNDSRAQEQLQKIVNNEMADFAEFKADQALKKMEYEMGKAQSVPMPVGED